MSEMIRITVLVENSVHRQGLVAEHGLCFHIQSGSHQLLFDTGQSDLAVINAATLRLPLDPIEALVLSHGHYDHTGGVPTVLDMAPEAKCFVHPAAFEPKYSRNAEGHIRQIGMSDVTLQALNRRGLHLVETRAQTEVLPGVFATGEIPRLTPYEDTGGAFYLDTAGTRPDPLLDDQALIIDLGRSVMLLLGCAHSGLVNSLNHVQHLTGGKPVSAVIGGFHLGSASAARLQFTLERLRAAELNCLAAAHCTGQLATARLWQTFPKICRPASVGSVFEFERG